MSDRYRHLRPRPFAIKHLYAAATLFVVIFDGPLWALQVTMFAVTFSRA